MTKKDYEAAAVIVQAIQQEGASGEEAGIVVGAFMRLFRDDNPRFDVARFARACVPGANVKGLT